MLLTPTNGNSMSDLAVIKEIEQIIGRKLTLCSPYEHIMSWEKKCCYQIYGQKITSLNLHSCQLTNINILKDLVNLQLLNLSHNELSDITALQNLTNLRYLKLIDCQLNNITALNNLMRLEALSLQENNIKNITDLGLLTNITQLNLSINQLSDITALNNLTKLTWLDLRYNNLIKLPEWLLNFNMPIGKYDPEKGGIYLGNNPLEEPPIEIVKQGNEAIRTYFQQLKKDGADYIYEAKLILVGQPSAGKTSLANKIIDANYQLPSEVESESTRGIDILRYSFPYKDKTFQTNIWDFAGQEIYYQTHKFFLTKRSVYLLVADCRKQDTNFYFWLNIVRLLSKNSPLLIIKNEKQNQTWSIPEEAQLKAEFDIKDILATNLFDNRGLTQIIDAVQYQLSHLPHIGSTLPKTWLKVRQQLEQDPRYYIRLDEYLALCQANGFDNYDDKLQLSGYLHDLGVCLHFQEHSLLNKTVILKPTWATDAVYKVLDNDIVKANYGRFNKSDLKTIWQNPDYQTMHGDLLALMLKFKLCYEMKNRKNHYIIPQLLADKKPNYPWQEKDNLLLRYRYDFMPKGIISQFIVEMHESIANNYECVWQSGVVLEKENSVAEIIEYYSKREIMIRAYGSNRKELLTIVSHELDKINDRYEQLKDKCKKLVPCHCTRCIDLQKDLQEPHFYDYSKLKQRLENNKRTVECENPPYEELDVLKLIDTIGFYVDNKSATGNTIVNANNFIQGNVYDSNISGNDSIIK